MYKLGLIAVGLSALMAFPGQAEIYRLSTHGPEAHPLHRSIPFLAEELNAAGEGMEFEPFMSAVLAEGKDTLKIVKTGVAQGGLIIGAYAPSDLPLNNVLNAATIGIGDQAAAALAITELSLTNPRIQQEWKDAGVVFGSGYSTPPLWLYCTALVTNTEQFRGKKTWATSGTQSALIKALGGVPVSVSVNDVYSGLQRGSLDCAANDPSGIVRGFRWGEIANNITTMPLGLVMGGALYAWNPKFWKSRTPEQRQLIMDKMADGLGGVLAEYQQDTIDNVEGGRKAGATVTEPDPEFVAARDAFNEQYMVDLVAGAISGGLEDPQPVLDEFFALLEKWQGELDQIDRTDASAIADLVRDKIYSRVDAASYGVDA